MSIPTWKRIVHDVIKYCNHPRQYKNTFGRWKLWLEVTTLIGGITSMTACDCLWQLWKGVEQTWWVRRTCTHVIMYVHTLNKVWDHMRGDWDIHVGLSSSAHICVHLCKGTGGDMGNQVAMHTCTDKCTHSIQFVGPNEGWLGHADGATLGLTFVWDYVQGVQHKWRTRWICRHINSCTQSNQGVGTEEGWLGHTYWVMHSCLCLCTTIQGGWNRSGELSRKAYMYQWMYTF